MDPVVHLHLHTRYSLLDGLGHERRYARKAREDGQPALAVTDHGALFGIFNFVRACLDEGVQPIIGCELYVVPGQGSRFDRSDPHEDEAADRGSACHLTVLVKNEQGYKNLLKLVSKGWTEGFYRKPRVDKALLAEHAEGLIATSGCPMGEVARLILAGRIAEAERLCCWYRDVFGEENFYLEIQDHGLAMERTIREGLLYIHRRTGIPLVATNDAHYVEREDAEAHDVLLCIQTASDLNDPKRMKMSDDHGNLLPAWYMLTSREMRERFRDLPEAVDNTLRIYEQVKLFGFRPVIRGYHPDFRYLLPEYPVPPGHTPQSWLRHLTLEGARRRYGDPIPQDRLEQIEHELRIIHEAGFDNYFLLVQDVVNWARNQGIPVGHGRGSGCGSEVAYCLGITNIPPKQYGLIFERFLHLYRVSMPDFDIDIADDRREEVVEYIRQRWGEGAVAQIATFGSMAARAAVRRVAKVLGVSLSKADQIARAIPTLLEAKNLLKEKEQELAQRGIPVPKKNMTIDAALVVSPELRRMYEQDAEARKVLDIARLIEGVPSHASRHAGGFVIAPGELTEYAPVFVSKGVRTIQFDLVDTEDAGLLKMDFLGLRTLRTVRLALDLVERHFGVKVDLERIPLDDARTLELLQRGDTAGVFQFESHGMRDVLRQMRPTGIEDLIAAVALFRPGPLQYIPTYCRRKHGLEPVDYPHPDLEPILRETYGIMVYQEQVMRIAQVLAGFDLGKADELRRAIGKKKHEEMARLQDEFIAGAEQRGYDRELAERLWADIVKFADYAFNKAHAVPYARLAYETAYLKAHYPAAFYAALLTTEAENLEKLAEYIRDARAHGISVLPPDVNRSGVDFEVVDDRTVIYGLGAIRDVGAAAEDIVRERERGGEYLSLMDLCMRVPVSRKVVEALIRAGACRSLGQRARLLAALDGVSERARQVLRAAGEGQLLLDSIHEELRRELRADPSLDAQEPPEEERLHEEAHYLGYYLTGHPLGLYRHLLQAAMPYERLVAMDDNADVVAGGLVLGLKERPTRNGKLMATAQLQVDEEHHVELVIFPDVYESVRGQIENRRCVLVHGKLRREQVVLEDEEDQEQVVTEVQIRAARIQVFPKSYEMPGYVVIRPLRDALPRPVRERIRTILDSSPGHRTIPVLVAVKNGTCIGWADKSTLVELRGVSRGVLELDMQRGAS